MLLTKTYDSINTEDEKWKSVCVDKHLLLQTPSVGIVGSELGDQRDDSNG